MRRGRGLLVKASWISLGAGLVPWVFLLILAAWLPVPRQNPWAWIFLGTAGVVFSGLLYSLASKMLALTAAQSDLQERLRVTEQHQAGLKNQLAALHQMKAEVEEAQDEKTLMERVLVLTGALVGARGSSYTPLDEWGQPLGVVNAGELSEPDRSGWETLLGSEAVREACRTCKIRQAKAGEACLLCANPLRQPNNLQCVPVRRGEMLLGMVNFYLPPEVSLDGDQLAFVEDLLSQTALALEAIRQRNQELATLRHLQLIRDPSADLTGSLTSLLISTQRALEVNYAMLVLRAAGRTPPQVVFGEGQSEQLDIQAVQDTVQECLRDEAIISLVNGEGEYLPSWLGALLVIPLSIPEQPALGALVVGNHQPRPFYPRQRQALESAAVQTALLVENQRLMVNLEYQAVIAERTRLAREIHDGLAQTLAFLKLQVQQMHNSLGRGEMDRLKELITTSQATLKEAYLDARQAIDNLRVTPQEGMRQWLDQAIFDFQETVKIEVRLSFQAELQDLPLEIQAQLIRVVQEALNNIRKHAHACLVIISFHRWQGDLILEITDDGQGFTADEVPSVSQHGLRGIQERADMIGADFQIISQPDQGTTVRLRLPYPLEETPA